MSHKHIHEWAHKYGTPFYWYDLKKITQQYTRLKEAFAQQKLPIKIHYSVKANSNLSVLRHLHSLGSYFDVVSGGELQRCLHIGAKGSQIVFAGVGKTQDEVDLALKNSILQFNVESADELYLIAERAQALAIVAPVALRINPDVDAKTHAYITTGTHNSKFGIALSEAFALYEKEKLNPHLKWVGLDMHIGSQMTEEEPIQKSTESFAKFVNQLNKTGIVLQNLDIGGGLGVSYNNDKVISPERFAELVAEGFKNENFSHEELKNYNIILEPGRFLVAESGQLIGRVQAVKDLPKKCFVVVDAGMTELMRPTLYGAHHQAQLLPSPQNQSPNERPQRLVDIVGPICESSDFLAKDRSMPLAQVGDLVAISNCGAYASSMSHTYNTRGRAPELLWDEDKQEIKLIRRRESFNDLLRLEIEI